ncbi:Nicotinate-nucleotide adenylyltransferase [compost metagenome]
MTKKRVGIYGSSFDPITNVHLWTASTVASREDLDLVIFLPCSSGRRADTKKMKTEDEHRVKMVKMAIKDNPKFEFSGYELDVDYGIATTYLTMQYFQEVYPDADLFFIMGADLLNDLPSWRQGEELIKNFNFIVMAREGYDMLKIIATNPVLRNNQRRFHLMDKGLAMEISSTYIRDEIAMGGEPRYLLPEPCYNYIKEHKLYTDKHKNRTGMVR